MKSDDDPEVQREKEELFDRLLDALSQDGGENAVVVEECMQHKHGQDAYEKARIMLSLRRYLKRRGRHPDPAIRIRKM